MSRRKNRKLEKLKKVKKKKQIIKIISVIIITGIVFCANNKVVKEKVALVKNRNFKFQENRNIIESEETKEVIAKQETIQPKVEETTNNEDSEIKTIVEKYINNENLNEENFAFVYYNANTEKYYFYNEKHYFTAASTIKVPLAMLYYDKINNGDITLKTKMQFKKEEQYEDENGNIENPYKIGTYIALSTLLENMIVNSDNTATNILKTELGGENAYRMLIKQYTKIQLPKEFNDENIISAEYALDILKKIYQNQEQYKALIELMKKSSNGGYLKKNIKNCEIAHKYGSYEGNIHDFGICFAKKEYMIGIFTKNIEDAEELISSINKEILVVNNR